MAKKKPFINNNVLSFYLLIILFCSTGRVVAKSSLFMLWWLFLPYFNFWLYIWNIFYLEVMSVPWPLWEYEHFKCCWKIYLLFPTQSISWIRLLLTSCQITLSHVSPTRTKNSVIITVAWLKNEATGKKHTQPLVKSFCLDNSGLTPSLHFHASLNSVSSKSNVSKTLFHIMFSYCKTKMNYF